MSQDRSQQPAVLLRKIRMLEAHLAAVTESRDKAFDMYRQILYANVELRGRLEDVEAALRGELTK